MSYGYSGKKKYSDSSGSSTIGKITKVKVNVDLKKSNGQGTFKGSLLVIEDKEGDEHKFRIGARSKTTEYLKNLKEGDDVTVKEAEGDYGKQVVAVYNNSFKKYGSGGKSEYNATGAIQGMVLKAAIDLAISYSTRLKLDISAISIVDAAKIVLEAKSEVDKLVDKAINKSKTKEDDNDDVDSEEDDEVNEDDGDETDSEDEDSDDDAPEEKPSKKKSKKEVY